MRTMRVQWGRYTLRVAIRPWETHPKLERQSKVRPELPQICLDFLLNETAKGVLRRIILELEVSIQIENKRKIC